MKNDHEWRKIETFGIFFGTQNNAHCIFKSVGSTNIIKKFKISSIIRLKISKIKITGLFLHLNYFFQIFLRGQLKYKKLYFLTLESSKISFHSANSTLFRGPEV